MKPIPSAPKYYADAHGQIWRYGRHLAGTYNNRGYLRVTLSINGATETRYVHRLVCEAFRGPCPEGFECRHLNGIPDDNHLANLEWSDKATNEADKIAHGTLRRGERHGNAVLTDAQVIEARARASLGATPKTIARAMRLPVATLTSAVMGRRYKHLPGARESYSSRRKFSPDQVREIRRRASEGPTALAKEFGVVENSIRQIVSGKSYSHVVD